MTEGTCGTPRGVGPERVFPHPRNSRITMEWMLHGRNWSHIGSIETCEGLSELALKLRVGAKTGCLAPLLLYCLSNPKCGSRMFSLSRIGSASLWKLPSWLYGDFLSESSKRRKRFKYHRQSIVIDALLAML